MGISILAVRGIVMNSVVTAFTTSRSIIMESPDNLKGYYETSTNALENWVGSTSLQAYRQDFGGFVYNTGQVICNLQGGICMKFSIVRRVMVLISIVIITCISLFMIDANKTKQYSSMKYYDSDRILLNYDEQIDKENINDLIKLAKRYNVWLARKNYLDKKVQVYYSGDNIESVLKELGLNYQKRQGKNYASTIINSDSKFYIPDLLNNDKYEFYLLDDYLENDGYIFGEYFVYYQNSDDYTTFNQEAKKMLGESYDTSKYGGETYQSDDITKISIIVIIVAVFFYFMIEIFSVYRSSKKIAIMKMMGFGDLKVYYQIVRQELLYYFLVIVVFLIGDIFLVKNITFNEIIQIGSYYIMMMISFCIVSLICVLLITRKKDLFLALKNKQMIKLMVYVSGFTRGIISIFIMILLVSIFVVGTSLKNQYTQLENLKTISDYAVFARIVERSGNAIVDYSNPETIKQHSDLNELYKGLSDTSLEYIYADFSQYEVFASEDIKRTNQAIKSGDIFPYATIDTNYINKVNLNVYDANENIVTLEKGNKERFIFPKSAIKYREEFFKYYTDTVGKDYDDKALIDQTVYTYDEMDFPLYEADESGNTILKSNLTLKYPILRVIYPEYPYNYIDSMNGIDIAGTGMSTSLKINTHGDKKALYGELLPILQRAKIDDMLPIRNFVTVGEINNEQIQNLNNIFISEVAILLVIFIIYVITTLEIQYLLVEKESKKIIVKTFMGFDRYKINKNIYAYVVFTFIIPFIGVCSYFLTQQSATLFTMLLIGLILFFIDNLLYYIATKKITIKNILVYMKGENL